jgi:hypothetical protein
MTQKKMIKKTTTSKASYGAPKYPYTSTPVALNRFMQLVPTKPKPEKVNPSTLKAWGFKNTNDQSIIRVLKALDLVSTGGEPTQNYLEYMQPVKGPAVLGQQIRKVYPVLFSTVSNPGNASTDDFRGFFNTYGGGSEEVVRLQLQTFKTLVGFATFGASDPLEQQVPDGSSLSNNTGSTINTGQDQPTIRIDLHIHLPESKTKSDYESILESIAKHLYGRNI